MSMRLQVLLSEEEAATLRGAAQRDGLTVSEWVRQSIREATARQTTGRSGAKLSAIAVAVDYAFPTADIEVMLDEIEHRYAE